MTSPPRSLLLAFTGASGLPYGLRLLEGALAAGCSVSVIYSQAAQIVAKQELNLVLPARASDGRRALLDHLGREDADLAVYGRDDYFAPCASGSNPPDAMVVCPCSMGTLAAIRAGLADNLIERAADVMLKERRPLVLVPRETPFSTLHLENMLHLSRLGVIILPPSPGFYTHPASIADLVDFVVARILDQLRLPHRLHPRWGAP